MSDTAPRKPRRKGKVIRCAGFTIRIVDRLQPYFVDVRQRNFKRRQAFASLDAARRYCQALRTERDEKGLSAFNLTDAARLDASDAMGLLGGRCTLTEAAHFWRKYHPDAGAVTLGEMLPRYRAHLKSQQVRPATLRALWRLERVARELGTRALLSIGAEDLRQWLDGRGFAPTNRNNYRRALSAFFAYCVAQDLMQRNPVERVPVVKVEAAPITFWSVSEVAALLRTTERLYPGLLPLFSVMAFAGLRPAEAEALRWEHINLTDRIIRVEGSTSKTRARRIVKISENLAAWLTANRGKAGALAPKPQTLRRWRQRIAAAMVVGDVPERMQKRKGMKGTEIKAAGLSWAHIIADARTVNPKLWPPDILRHAFATHWLAVFKDENELAQEMGNSPAVIHRHYRGLATEGEGRAYWAITPGPANVIRLRQASA